MYSRIIFVAQKIKLQLVIIAIIAIIPLAMRISGIKFTSELVDGLLYLFDRYGLPIVFISSFIEHIVGVNVYFPGSAVIVTAMILSFGHPVLALSLYLVEVSGAILAYLLDYILGKLIVKSKKEVIPEAGIQKLIVTLISGMWHPHFGAIASMTAAKQGYRLSSFVFSMIPIVVFWDSLWAILIYNFSSFFTAHSGSILPIFLIYIAVWTFYDIVKAGKEFRIKNYRTSTE